MQGNPANLSHPNLLSSQMDHPVVQRSVLVVRHGFRVPGVKDPVAERVRPTEDEGVAVREGGGDLQVHIKLNKQLIVNN